MFVSRKNINYYRRSYNNNNCFGRAMYECYNNRDYQIQIIINVEDVILGVLH